MKDPADCKCEREIERARGPNFLIRSECKDGERVTCPGCKAVYVHVCDEAEGCSWHMVRKPARVKVG